MSSPFLKVIDRHPEIAEELQFDGYLPLQADFGDAEGGNSIYWYLLPEKSIVKLTVDSKSDRLLTVDCVALERARIVKKSTVETCESIESGLPIVDTSLWEHGIDEYHFRTDEALSVSVDTNAIQLFFGTDPKIVRELQSGNVFFGVDESQHLRSVRFAGLSADQINEFLNTCE